MYWGIYHLRESARAQSAATRAQGKADRVQVYIDRLEDRVDSLALVCQAMWELLSESMPDATNRLDDKVREVDLRDGEMDGKMNRAERSCSNCQRALHKRHNRCLYCGEEMTGENIFQR